MGERPLHSHRMPSRAMLPRRGRKQPPPPPSHPTRLGKATPATTRYKKKKRRDVARCRIGRPPRRVTVSTPGTHLARGLVDADGHRLVIDAVGILRRFPHGAASGHLNPRYKPETCQPVPISDFDSRKQTSPAPARSDTAPRAPPRPVGRPTATDTVIARPPPRPHRVPRSRRVSAHPGESMRLQGSSPL